ncbi:MAG: electron transfer flavoprotein subunit alpha/FixB family protein [Acidobacteria bacterium]|nr:electron transfer flavoprotein subunit alpha/FixB family protein [Acidobacteriota bacterium]
MSILVFIERQAERWHPMSWEALAAGQQIARELNVPLYAAAVGAGLAAALAEVTANRLDRAVALDNELLRDYSADGFVIALRQAIDKFSPTLVLFPHTYQVRDFAPNLAASLKRPFVSDAVAVRLTDGRLGFVRQMYQGKLHADVTLDGEPPFFASLQSGSFRADQLQPAGQTAPVETLTVAIDPSQIRTRSEAPFRESKGEVDLSSARIIVSVGRGIKEEDNIGLARELAEAIGGELAASRPICDNGWLPLERQIGSSGQTVSPKLYVALGISGAIQHVVGMKGSQTIVAINRDPTAPIFELADYGVAADLFEIVPALTKALRAAAE